MNNSQALKKYINRTVFFGVLAAAVAFIVAIYQPRQYLIVGKMVVFPAGSASAEKNLGYEVGNTVQIINSVAFKSSNFQGLTGNFAYAKQIGNSSTIALAMYAQKNQQIAVEDTIVRIPNAVADFTRDLYGGSPFKYRLLSDPEISVNPVKPDIAKFLSLGFLIGALLYFIYWFLFELLRIPAENEIAKVYEEIEEKVADIAEKEKEEAPQAAKIGAGTIELANGRPSFKPGGISKAESETKSSEKNTSVVPENLPVTSEDAPPIPQSEEPTDDEVKERLNRLMRGEL